MGDLGLHGGEFGVGVEEVAGARADHGEDGNVDCGASLAHEFDGGSEAALRKIGAEFDTVGTGALGGLCGGQGFYGDFQEEGHLGVEESCYDIRLVSEGRLGLVGKEKKGLWAWIGRPNLCKRCKGWGTLKFI